MVMASPYSPYRARTPMQVPPIVVYGTGWCAASQMVRRYLDRLGLPYRYVDLEYDPAAVARLRWLTGGAASHPTVYIGGEWLVEPTISEIQWALARAGVL
jgi:mycoredoxin